MLPSGRRPQRDLPYLELLLAYDLFGSKVEVIWGLMELKKKKKRTGELEVRLVESKTRGGDV